MIDIKMKEEKHHKSKEKQRTNKKSDKNYQAMGEECCEILEANLAASEQSPILRSPIPDRRNQRREAVAEQNLTERAVVKSTLKHYMMGEHSARYSLK